MQPLFLPVPSDTRSVCPECLRTLPARLVRKGREVRLEKTCPEHGASGAVIWRGELDLESWRRGKTPTPPAAPYPDQGHGCPWDCGLCANHRQRTCTVLLEITRRCNLRCPVCFADSGAPENADPGLPELEERLRQAFAQSGPVPVQLSGGEPTMRDDVPEVINVARRIGFPHVQLNTNGLRLAQETGYAAMLRQAGLSWVFLQFDGCDDAVFTRLRGRPLLHEKLAAVHACAGIGLGVVLVPTVVPGVNDHDLGNLIRLAARHVPTVRGVHFQPISYFGRYPAPPGDPERITLPEIMRGLEQQTTGQIRLEHFRPPGCEHERCSFHGNFTVQPDGSLQSMASDRACCEAKPSAPGAGAQAAIDVVARQWAAPEIQPCGQERIVPSHETGDLDAFLARVCTRTLAVTGMAFQDAWTLDLERLKGCCIHVCAPDGRLVPFCAWNLTSRAGWSPHRSGTWPC